MMKIGKPEYMQKAAALSHDEQQRILSRMTGKLPKRLIKEKLSIDEAIAIQLEIEEEQLEEWRKNWDKIRKQDSAKEPKASAKPVAKTAASKPVAATKTAKSATTTPAPVKPAAAKPKKTTKATS
ncbi:hypothetical protein MTYP_02434 [Methylophilaceae bacterium]|nr:hypothetical protein MTYP_02434 [Methylophilaceae bacterium]